VFEQRQLRIGRLAIAGDAFDVLVVDREKLLQNALAARVERITDGRDVAGGIPGVLLIGVGTGVVDIPIFFQRL
jgi:hypothetical protein